MRWPTPPTGPDGAGITNTAPRPATTPATELGSHDQRSTTAVLVSCSDCVAVHGEILPPRPKSLGGPWRRAGQADGLLLWWKSGQMDFLDGHSCLIIMAA